MRLSRILKGIKPTAANPFGGWLKMDTTQYVSLPSTAFYDLGGKNLTFIVRAIPLRLGTGSGSRVASFLVKGSVGVSDKFFSLGTLSGSSQNIGFRFGLAGTVNRAFGITTSLETKLAEELVLAFRRSNQDGTLTAANTLANYSVSINGAPFETCTVTSSTGTLTSDPYTNTHAVQFRQASTLDFMGYLGDVAVYDYAMTDAEIADIYTTGNFPSANNYGKYGFNSLTGTAITDDSSVANHGTANNYVSADLGVPTATDVRYRVPGVVPSKTGNFTKTIVCDVATSIFKFGRYNSATGAATVVHKRGGVTQATHNLTFPSGDVENAAITILSGDTLEITATSATTNWALEIFTS